MPRTIRTKVYQFKELDAKAKQKAIEWGHDLNTSHDWWELSEDSRLEELSEHGFPDSRIYFSGFWSQGDGACFICPAVDFTLFLGGKYKDADVTASITHSWRYYFATSTTVNLESGDTVTTELHNEIEQAIKDERERLGNKIYGELEKEYSYLVSEEAIAETIEANEYEFTKDGKRFQY